MCDAEKKFLEYVRVFLMTMRIYARGISECLMWTICSTYGNGSSRMARRN